MELFIGPGNVETFLLKLIISYLKLEQRSKIKLISLSEPALTAIQNGKLNLKLPTLVTDKAEVIEQTFQITRHLVSLQPVWADFFLGKTQQQKKEILNIKVHYKQGKQLRKYLQKYLENKTFFVSNHLTFADLYMFTQLYQNMQEMSDDQKNQYNNIFRWYKHIQNLPQIKAFLEKQNRLVIGDPEVKLNFLEVKKKKKKDEEKPKQKQKQKQHQKKQEEKQK